MKNEPVLTRIAVDPSDRAAVGHLLRGLDERAASLGARVSTHRHFDTVTAVAFSRTIRAERTHRFLVDAIELALGDFEQYVYTADELAQIARQSI